MILNHTPNTNLFHMGEAVLLLNAGHAEYDLKLNDRVTIHRWADDELDDSIHDSVPAAVPAEFRDLARGLDLDGWETVLHVGGPVHDIAHAFYRLACDLDPFMDPAQYTPGGDDDTFDYWPSGMNLLYQLAVDLDEMTKELPNRGDSKVLNYERPTLYLNGNRYRARYHEVLHNAKVLNVPEMEGIVPGA